MYTIGELLQVIKEGQVAKCVDTGLHEGREIIRKGNAVCWNEEGNKAITLSSYILESAWELKPSYMTFDDALKVYKEGKVVRCHLENDPTGVKNWNSKSQNLVSWDAIVHGKWYLDDEKEIINKNTLKTSDLFNVLNESNEACCTKGVLIDRTVWLDKERYLICQYHKTRFNLSKDVLECEWKIYKR